MRKPSPTTTKLLLVTGVVIAQLWNSARDIIDVALPRVHGDLSRALTFPASIDLMILAAAVYMAVPKGVNKKARRWAFAARYIGFGATIYANIMASGITTAADYGNPDVWASAVFMLIPALALICTLEMVIHAKQGTPASRAARTAATGENVTPMRRRTATA